MKVIIGLGVSFFSGMLYNYFIGPFDAGSLIYGACVTGIILYICGE